MMRTGHGPRRLGLMGSTHETYARHCRHGAPALPLPDRLRRRRRRRRKAGSKSSASDAASDLPTGIASCLPTDLPTEIPSDLASYLPTDLPTGIPTDLLRDPPDLPSGIPTDLPSGIPTDLPTEVPTDLPTAVPTQASGGALDACAVVTPALIKADLGATTGPAMGQPSSFGDPNAKDCYYIGGEATIVIQATTRADQDLPESAYSYAGLPGAEPIPGATRGWVFVFPGQDGADTITSGLILVKGQIGINFSITIAVTPTRSHLQKLAKDMLAAI